MKKLLLLLLSLSFIGSANAVSSLDDYYTSLCVGEKSTGFDWVNGDWELANFVTYKYLATKVEATNQEFCSDSKNPLELYYADQTLTTYGCYRIKRFGRTANFPFDCIEKWTTFTKEDEEANPKTKELISVSCENFRFEPNGWFQKDKLDGINSYSILKNSIYIEVGKCSTL